MSLISKPKLHPLAGRWAGCPGLDRLSRAFLDEQYEWLMNWKNLRERKGLPKG